MADRMDAVSPDAMRASVTRDFSLNPSGIAEPAGHCGVLRIATECVANRNGKQVAEIILKM